MIESLSYKIAVNLKKSDPQHKTDVEVLEWQIGIYLNYIFAAVLTMLFGSIIGHLLDSCLAMLLFILIRRFSGGVHLTSLTACSLLSAFIFVTVPLIPLSSLAITVLTLLSALVFLLYAPNDFEDLNPTRLYPYLKWISVSIVLSNLFFHSPVIAAIFSIQAVFILPIWRGGAKNEKRNRT